MLRSLVFSSLVIATVLVALGCQPEAPNDGPPAEGTTMQVPAGPGSGQPHLVTGRDGRVWMSWLEPVDEERHAFRYAVLQDTTWSEPTTVARGSDWFVNWADVPSLQTLPEGRLAAHYLRSNGPSSLAYEVRIAQATAEGEWGPAVTPHDDGTETEHGFASLLPWSDSRLLAVWLDGRKMEGQSGHGGEMTLRGAVLDSSGTVKQRALLDGRTCECCPTTAVRVGEDALVAYRDRTENEIRNIQLVRFNGRSWSEPTVLHDDGWQIAGCPVNGPALAAEGERVAAAWFTAPDGTPRVNVALSTDGGHTFGEPVVVAKGDVKGRVDVVLLDDGTAVASWLGHDGETPALRARTVDFGEELGTSFTLASLASSSRGVGMPRMVRAGQHLYAAWTRPTSSDSEGAVRMVRLDLAEL